MLQRLGDAEADDTVFALDEAYFRSSRWLGWMQFAAGETGSAGRVTLPWQPWPWPCTLEVAGERHGQRRVEVAALTPGMAEMRIVVARGARLHVVVPPDQLLRLGRNGDPVYAAERDLRRDLHFTSVRLHLRIVAADGTTPLARRTVLVSGSGMRITGDDGSIVVVDPDPDDLAVWAFPAHMRPDDLPQRRAEAMALAVPLGSIVWPAGEREPTVTLRLP